MKNYGVILGPKFLTVIADKSYSITTADARYAQAVEFVKNKAWADFFMLLDKPAMIARYSQGLVKVYNNEIHYGDAVVHGAIAERILKFINDGFDFKPLVSFLDNLYKNTDENVRQKLYLFLENNNLAITEDGGFLAYKLVKEDGSPFYHSGSFFDESGNAVTQYSVGKVFKFPRERIVKTSGECSTEGLYVGNSQYWNREFDKDNNYTGTGRMLIVKVMPQDVCNIPHADAAKIVVCKLDVLSEYKTVKTKANQSLFTDKTEAAGTLKPKNVDFFADFNDSNIGPELVSTSRNVPARDEKGRFSNGVLSSPKRDKRGRFAKKSSRRDKKGRFVS